jgi:ribosomal protein S27AE
MYKPHPDDIRARNINFIVHGELPPWPTMRAADKWAAEHGFPCAQPDIITNARTQFFNSWPADGQTLDVEGLEAAYALAQQPKAEARRDCGRCGTTLSKDNRARGLCGRCSKAKFEERHERIVGRSLPTGGRSYIRAASAAGLLPTGGRSYIRAASAAGLRHTLCHDGTSWYIDCHDGATRQPEAAWSWLLAQKEIYHIPECRAGMRACGMDCRKQRELAGVTIDDYARTL